MGNYRENLKTKIPKHQQPKISLVFYSSFPNFRRIAFQHKHAYQVLSTIRSIFIMVIHSKVTSAPSNVASTCDSCKHMFRKVRGCACSASFFRFLNTVKYLYTKQRFTQWIHAVLYVTGNKIAVIPIITKLFRK